MKGPTGQDGQHTTMDNRRIARDLYDALNAGRLDAVDRLVADTFVEHEAFPGVPGGRQGLRLMFQTLHAAFSDFSMTVEDMVAEGDKVCARVTMRGTQRQTFLGIPSKGKSMVVPLVDVIRFEHGRAVEHWGVMDSGQMMQQLL